ncbi:helix-turn-helix domain-containing protein [Bacillus pacificus]
MYFNEHFNTYKEVESLSAIRTPTREELYRSLLCIAHDYIRAYYDKTIKLNDIARISCLSPNHLLRTYTQIYGKTPHQHISEFREQSKTPLSELSNNMTDITFKTWISKLVSFSKMFKQHVTYLKNIEKR